MNGSYLESRKALAFSGLWVTFCPVLARTFFLAALTPVPVGTPDFAAVKT